MQMLGNSPVLQQSMGGALPRIWAHLMSLGGVTGIDQYMPQGTTPPAQQQQPAQQVIPPTKGGSV